MPSYFECPLNYALAGAIFEQKGDFKPVFEQKGDLKPVSLARLSAILCALWSSSPISLQDFVARSAGFVCA
jgi:hypothetical protein